MNIINTIWRNGTAYQDHTAVIYKGQVITFGSLLISAELASARLTLAGISRGDVVATTIGNPLIHLVIILALARIGAIATPIGPEVIKKQRDDIVSLTKVSWVILEREEYWQGSSVPPSRLLKIGPLLEPPAKEDRLAVPPAVQGLDNEPWLFASTSGTTGFPKINPQSHARSALLACLSPRTKQDDEGRLFLFMSLGIENGITLAIRQLYRGDTTIILSPSLLPEMFFATVQRDKPTRVATTTAQAYAITAYAISNVQNSLEMCSSLKSIAVSGSVVPPTLRKDISERICPGLEVGYGSTETGSLAMATPETYKLNPNSTGRLNRWVYAEAVDENDNPLPAGTRGILRFKSLTSTTSYLGDEEKTSRVFSNGWFYPGDTGMVSPAGDLFLGGRVDHVINMGGVKIDSRRIEELLENQPTIVEAAVISLVNPNKGIPQMIAVVEAPEPIDAIALKLLCLDELGALYTPHEIIRVDSLPRNKNGKVMRATLAANIKFTKNPSTTQDVDE
jgi:acyl-coenzyme A synthetase/AMP-(fatty) acid ligase